MVSPANPALPPQRFQRVVDGGAQRRGADSAIHANSCTRPTSGCSAGTPPPVPGAKLTFVAGDVRPVHAAMRAAACDKNVWIVGGGELAGAFVDAGLLDELILGVAPVTLGAGAPLLPRRTSWSAGPPGGPLTRSRLQAARY
jgi:hypothetical protein